MGHRRRDAAPEPARRTPLCDGAGDDKVGHPVIVVSEDVTQDHVGVLADRRAGPRGVRRGARVGPVGTFDERLAMVGMGDQAEVVPVGQLRVVHALRRVLHVVGGDVGGLEAILDDLGRVLARPGADDPVELYLAGAPLVGGEVGEVVAADEVGEPAPAVVVLAGDGYPAVVAGSGVDAVGHERRVVVSSARRDPSVHRPVEQCRRQQVQGGLTLGDVDVLALAGAPGVVDGRQGGERGEAWGDVVGVREEWPGRRHGPASR